MSFIDIPIARNRACRLWRCFLSPIESPPRGNRGSLRTTQPNRFHSELRKSVMPARLRVGHPQEPERHRKLLDDQHSVVLEVTPLSEQDFRATLSQHLKRLNSRTCDLFIHGIDHSFDSGCARPEHSFLKWTCLSQWWFSPGRPVRASCRAPTTWIDRTSALRPDTGGLPR